MKNICIFYLLRLQKPKQNRTSYWKYIYGKCRIILKRGRGHLDFYILNISGADVAQSGSYELPSV